MGTDTSRAGYEGRRVCTYFPRHATPCGESDARNILLTGVPGVGKTTLVRRVIEKIDARIGGFYTEEIRERGKRVGFSIKTFDGRTGILAHVNHKGAKRVGKYGVNIEDIEGIAAKSVVSALKKDDLIVIDELGRMELYSDLFQRGVKEALDSDKPVLSTIQVRRNPFLDAIRARDDVQLVQVTNDNRDALAEPLARELELLLEVKGHD